MTELIILVHLKDLPLVGLIGHQQISPIEEGKVLAWGKKYKAERVYYWRRTKSAFITITERRKA
jgi:hypothetical protein